VFDELIALEPTYSKGYNNKGTIYFSLKNNADALIYFKKALDINQEYDTARINLGITLNEIG
jgi:superkiller protein 3